jgi:uncharacterized protein (TIGR02145 family)
MKNYLLLSVLVLNCVLYAQTSQTGTTKSVKIGTQTWTTENLNVSTFRNGDPIMEAKTNEEWEQAGENKQPAWCYYENDPKNGAKYGKLYNWYAVNDSRGLAPAGWHVPSDAEWTTLSTFLGGESTAGKKMKSLNGWNSYTSGGSKTCPNCASWNAEYRKKVPCHTCKDSRSVLAPTITHSGNGTNSSAFSGLPGGGRNYNGYFANIGNYGCWWSSTEPNTPPVAFYRSLDHSNDYLYRLSYYKGGGLSVRCIRD